MGSSPLRFALVWVWFLSGTSPLTLFSLRADVVKPGTAPVNTDSRPRIRERREPEQPTQPNREDRIPVIEAKRFKLLRGESLPIALDSVEDPVSQRVRFFIRDEPTAGFLSELSEPADDRSTATVTYHSDPASKATSDQFTYAAQYPFGRVCAAVPVVIEIVDPAPVISCVPTLAFGQTVLGAESVRSIVLSNKGTSMFELTPELPPPWKWLPDGGQTALRIPPGESVPATFGFAPVELGDAVFRFPLPTGLPEQPGVLFSGKGVVPFRLDSETFVLTYDPQTRQRTAKIALTNPGSAGLAVKLRLDPRLQSPNGDSVWLEREQRKELIVLLPPGDSSSFAGSVHFQSGDFERVVQVTGEPAPGFLSLSGVPSDASLDFGQVMAGKESAMTVRIQNPGGQALSATLAPPKAPFLLSGPDASGPSLQWTLPPGGAAELQFVFAPKEPGVFRDRLILASPDQQRVISLRGESMIVPSSVEVTAAANLTGTLDMVSGTKPSENAASQGIATGTTTNPGPAGNGDYRELFAKAPSTPASVATPAGRELVAAEVSKPARGRNGEIPLPPMISLDGMLALSPYKLKTDVKLPTVPRFLVDETTDRTARLVWPPPQGSPPVYEVETRITAFDTVKKRLECVWVPVKRVKFSIVDQRVVAEISGLQPESYYLFRIFTLGANGTNSLPSRELGARTKRSTMTVGTVINLGVSGLVLGGGFAIFSMLRREQLL